MKKLLFLGFVFSTVLMYSCTKDNGSNDLKEPVPTVLKDGYTWKAKFDGMFFTGSCKLTFVNGNEIKVDEMSSPYRWDKVGDDNIRLYISEKGKPQLNTVFGVNLNSYNNDITFNFGETPEGNVILSNSIGLNITLFK